jgi:hypothetical protein
MECRIGKTGLRKRKQKRAGEIEQGHITKNQNIVYKEKRLQNFEGVF